MRTKGERVKAWGYPGVIVANTDDIPGNCGQPGCYVVAMTGEGVANNTTPGEQWVVPPEDVTDDGAWQCGAGHVFGYEPPPASPPWCVVLGCKAGDYRWIVKDEVTERDWIPE